MARPFNPSLYFVTDTPPPGCSLVDLVMAAVAGGATMVELRDPSATTRQLVELGRALKARLAPLGVPLTTDDRVDVALAADLDGVHLVPDAMDAADARRLLGPDRIVGITMATEAHHRAFGHLLPLVDYVSVGPIFTTATLPSAGEGTGYAVIEAVRARTDRPLVAIGGLTDETAGVAVVAGAAGVAVVSAIMTADDPAAAARAIARSVATARG